MYDSIFAIMAAKITKAQLVEELSNGLKSVEIAEKYGLSKKTIEKYCELLRKETLSNNSAHLVAKYIRRGLIE